MEVAGYAITLNDVFVVVTLSYQAILIARLALKKIKKKDAKDVLRES